MGCKNEDYIKERSHTIERRTEPSKNGNNIKKENQRKKGRTKKESQRKKDRKKKEIQRKKDRS